MIGAYMRFLLYLNTIAIILLAGALVRLYEGRPCHGSSHRSRGRPILRRQRPLRRHR